MSIFRFASRATVLSRAAWSAPRLAPRARYSAAAPLTRDTVKSRVLEVLKGYEKVDESKVRRNGFHITGCSCL